MKAIPLMTIWTVSFCVSLATVESLSFLFWISFIAFGITSCYMAKHEKRFFREIEEFEKQLSGKK